MKRLVSFIIVFFSLFALQAQNLDNFFSKANLFFENYVSQGKVAYAQINNNPESLNELLLMAENMLISEQDKIKYQAFWINVYNIAVIKGIINNYPTNSPLNHDGFFDKTTYQLGGKKVTLNDIEHKLLRAKFKDPRFHFVLVCGAIGCPPLISEAYLPNTLDDQLELQTKKSINGSFLKVNVKKKRVEGSELLKWYKEDFTMEGISEIDFINLYRNEKIPNDYKLTFFPYNWNLNKQ